MSTTDHTATSSRSSDGVESRVDDAIARWQHRARVTSLSAAAVVAIALLLVLGAVGDWSGHDLGEATRAAKRVPATTNTSSRTPAGGSTAVPPSDAARTPPPERPTPRSDRTDRTDRTVPADDSSTARPDRSPATIGASPSIAPPDDATPPAITAISITPPDTAGVCTASWSADDGGTPIKEYVVSTESVVTPSGTEPDAAGTDAMPADTEAPTEVVDDKTTEAFTDAPLGSSLTVTARNAVGTSEPTEAVVCGG